MGFKPNPRNRPKSLTGSAPPLPGAISPTSAPQAHKTSHTHVSINYQGQTHVLNSSPMRNTCFTDTSTFHFFEHRHQSHHRRYIEVSPEQKLRGTNPSSSTKSIIDQSRSHPRKNPNSDPVKISNTNPIEIFLLALISCIGEHTIDPVEIFSDSQRIKALNPLIASQRKINFYCRRRRASEASTSPRSKADDDKAERASVSRNQNIWQNTRESFV